MKSRTYPLNLVLYLLLLYLRMYYTYWCTYCCMYVPTEPTLYLHTRTYSVYYCPVRTMYWYTYELHCWCTHVYILKKRYCCVLDRHLLHLHFVRTYFTYWCTYCMYLLLLHVRILQKKTTSCKYVPPAVRTYVLHLPGTRVPNGVRTHLLHILLFLLMHVRTHRTYCFNLC